MIYSLTEEAPWLSWHPLNRLRTVQFLCGRWGVLEYSLNGIYL